MANQLLVVVANIIDSLSLSLHATTYLTSAENTHALTDCLTRLCCNVAMHLPPNKQKQGEATTWRKEQHGERRNKKESMSKGFEPSPGYPELLSRQSS
jgi:hypothetical protein